MKFKFLSFEETPSVDGQRGIASILFMDEVILRYKLINRKDSTGWFLAPATIRGETVGDKTNWVEAFTLERNSTKEELLAFIRSEVNREKNPQKPQPVRETYDDVPF